MPNNRKEAVLALMDGVITNLLNERKIIEETDENHELYREVVWEFTNIARTFIHINQRYRNGQPPVVKDEWTKAIELIYNLKLNVLRAMDSKHQRLIEMVMSVLHKAAASINEASMWALWMDGNERKEEGHKQDSSN